MQSKPLQGGLVPETPCRLVLPKAAFPASPARRTPAPHASTQKLRVPPEDDAGIPALVRPARCPRVAPCPSLQKPPLKRPPPNSNRSNPPKQKERVVISLQRSLSLLLTSTRAFSFPLGSWGIPGPFSRPARGCSPLPRLTASSCPSSAGCNAPAACAKTASLPSFARQPTPTPSQYPSGRLGCGTSRRSVESSRERGSDGNEHSTAGAARRAFIGQPREPAGRPLPALRSGASFLAFPVFFCFFFLFLPPPRRDWAPVLGLSPAASVEKLRSHRSQIGAGRRAPRRNRAGGGRLFP